MSLRLLQIILCDRHLDELAQLLEEADPPANWKTDVGDGHRMTSVLIRSQLVEPLTDRLQDTFGSTEGFRLVLLPVEATNPKIIEPEDKPPPDAVAPEEPPKKKWAPRFGRISREELEEDIRGSAKTDPIFVIMVTLATVVACVGLIKDSPAIIIGAMVIAPLLGPNTALALGTTLGDIKMIRVAARSNLVGLSIAIALSLVFGVLALPDQLNAEVITRTRLDMFDILLALASGAAGAIAFTSGAPSTIVGVMVAVALLPPTAAGGMLAGAGEWKLAGGAVTMAITNIVCINLSATAVFLVQGVRPNAWWDKDRARSATNRALIIWTGVLAALAGLIAWAW
ncbi:MAG: TIGR00341 family protein [Planctomycetota bacterium]